MSRFFNAKYKNLIPYTPGEQPKERKFVKLNTNESPFPPLKKAVKAAKCAALKTNLYSDPEMTKLREAIAKRYGVSENMVIITNGSDEILNFAFMSFCDNDRPALFPNITYGFYPVFANLSAVPYKTFELDKDFRIDITPYLETAGTPFIANPNAPTGIALSVEEIEKIVASDPDRVVVVDEAYVDFGAESAVPLTLKYDNVLVTQTFSKSRSMAGARLGFGIANEKIISDLNTVRYSTNPYNVNSITLAMGTSVIENDEYTVKNCKTIQENREWTTRQLEKLGFVTTPSLANFIFARHPDVSGDKIYKSLREKGVLVRHFTAPEICDYNRITVGSAKQMRALILALSEILEEK